jgi:hypothetical protein
MIDLEFLTTDPDEIELCRRYWQLNDDGTFKDTKQAILPFGNMKHARELDLFIFASVVARDTRRACPTCAMPKLVNRETAVSAIEPIEPCPECEGRRNAHFFTNRSRRAAQAGMMGSGSGTRFPGATMATLAALTRAVDREKLRTGFSALDCQQLAPTHLAHFLSKLHATDVLEVVTPLVAAPVEAVPVLYRVKNAQAYEQDLVEFECLLKTEGSFDRDGLWELWSDYAIAECVAYVCSQSSVFGLPADPEDEALCSVLRIATATYSIAEVCAISQLAVRRAASLVRPDYSRKNAAETIPNDIARQCQAVAQGKPMPTPVRISMLAQHTRLRDWFHKWYGVFTHTRGPAVAWLLRPSDDSASIRLDKGHC